MRIAVHSDLHTEVSQCTLGGLSAVDLLILAGDIGDARSLEVFFTTLREQAPKLPVIFILGNHEFYTHEFFAAKAMYREICARFQVQMLDDEFLYFNDVLIIGSVLWSDFALAGEPEISKSWAQTTLPDFKFIGYQQGLFDVETMQVEHQRSVLFLEKALKMPARHKLVVSHFLPSALLVAPKHRLERDGLVRSAYWTSHLPKLYAKANTWIYGHSHDNIMLSDAGCRFISNQRGYSRVVNQASAPNYQRDFAFNLDLENENE